MKFWDSSAVVPLLVSETATASLQRLYARDTAMLVWWGTEVECTSAVARLEREGAIKPADVQVALDRLVALAGAWAEIEPASVVRRTAIRMLRTHQVRAADALQLAAAVVASEGDASSLPFVSLDDRLVEAARREGLAVVDP